MKEIFKSFYQIFIQIFQSFKSIYMNERESIIALPLPYTNDQSNI